MHEKLQRKCNVKAVNGRRQAGSQVGVDQDIFILYSAGELLLHAAGRCFMYTIGRNWTQIACLQGLIGATGAIHRDQNIPTATVC